MLKINNGNFEMNGEKFHIYSGAIHYFRIMPEYWEDRLKKLKAAGFNTVETYVCWNLHEPKKGEFDFSGRLDIRRFLQTAQKVGLYAIVRPGPYICAEWDFGGLPAWLLSNKNIRLRCCDSEYLKHVSDFYHRLYDEFRDLQQTKGGNIIAMQIENEYGSYGNDKDYLRYIKQLMLDCGTEVLLFTSDGDDNSMLSGGTLPDVFKTLNFGSGASERFKALDRFDEKTPKMCTEFWCGWFDRWGGEHHTRELESVVKEIKDFLDSDASFNFYMFHGGTNFGFTAGANYYETYTPTITSYDYSALLTEWGDYTPAYHAVRELMLNTQGIEACELPDAPTLQNIGKIELTDSTSLLENLDTIGEKHRSPLPEGMEFYGQNTGMIYYETKLEETYDAHDLVVAGVHDIAHVYIDGEKKTVIDRRDESKEGYNKVKFDGCSDGCTISVLVDAMGRVNYGEYLYDRKGITDIRYGNQNLMGYDVYTLPLDNTEKIDFSKPADKYPLFLRGKFKASSKADCFVHLDGFTKGCVYINGFNLGRYWNIGPQKALYLPGVLLKDENEIIVLELENSENPYVEITDKPDLG
ncbi:MAG: beta-galactosidase [Clostridia bacterium]|nr:beta-galactosidase [Clostridia bacterium]